MQPKEEDETPEAGEMTPSEMTPTVLRDDEKPKSFHVSLNSSVQKQFVLIFTRMFPVEA